MSTRVRPLIAVLAAVVVTTLAAAAPSAGEPGREPANDPGFAADAEAAPTGATVTLLTGDVVHYSPTEDGTPVVDIDAAPRPHGRAVTFHSFPTDDGYLVLPDDAIGLVANGTVDQDLFDLPTLAAEQAVDGDDDLPLLVEHPTSTSTADLRRDVRALSSDDTIRTLSSIDAAALEVPSSEAADFWAELTTSDELALTSATSRATPRPAASTRVWLDRTMTATLDESTEQVGAPTAWDLGLDGTGTTVAVLDTGIDPEHPDVADRIVATADFTGTGSTLDGHGHGTHVAGIVLGDGAASQGTFTGVAPAADLLVGKVLNDAGSGSMSQAIAGMEWAVAQGADVVNLSLSAGGGPTDGSDPASRALDTLSESSDTLFVVAAGNAGEPLTVRAPGAATAALTVGAVDDDDLLADFSSFGPRGGDAAVKPNLVAPGVAIGSARASGTEGPDPINEFYTRASGTSMAAPHVAGAAALVAQQHPDWDGAQIRDALVSTATPIDQPWFAQGGGTLDVGSAVTSDVVMSSSVDFGHLTAGADHRSRTRRVTFTNTGDRRVKLELSIDEFRGWSGARGPAGAVRVAPPKVVLPPGSTRTVRVRVAPGRGEPGAYGGFLAAESIDGEIELSVPFSYYTGTAHRVDFAGRSADGTSENPFGTKGVLVVGLGEPTSPEEPFHVDTEFVALDPSMAGGSQHLAEGDYQVIGLFPDLPHASTELVLERLSVTSDQRVLLDATDAVQMTPRLPEPTDLRGMQSVLLVDTADDDPFWLRSTSSGGAGGVLVTPQAGGGFRFAIQAHSEPAAVAEMRTADGSRYQPSYNAVMTRRLLGDGGTFEVVSVGAGDPGDYAGLDVAGKMVVIGVPVRTDAATPSHEAYFDLYSRAGVATGMGAAGVIAYLDHGDDPGGQVWNFGGLPVLGLSAAEGRHLAEAASNGPVEVTIVGNPEVDSVYRVRTDVDGEIPSTRPALGADDLVEVDARYHADRPGTSTRDTWASTTDDGFETLMPPADTLTAPLERTEYVGPARADLTWLHEVEQGGLAMRSQQTHDPDEGGTTTAETWFKAPLVPGAITTPTARELPPSGLTPPPWQPVEAPCALCRDGDRLVPALHWLDADPDHAGDLARQQVELFRDGTSIPVADGEPTSFVVGQDPGDYRLVGTALPPDRLFPESVTTETRFTSMSPSGRPEGFACSFGDLCAFQPAPQLRYDLPLDLLNRAQAGTTFAFEMTATSAGEAIADLSVQYSADGGTAWTDATVTDLGAGRFRVVVDNPPAEAGEVALRTRATDAHGNTVTQTILGAYGVD